MNKAPVLNKEMILGLVWKESWRWTEHEEELFRKVAQAQRDADHEYYDPIIKQAKMDGYELALEKLDIEFGRGYEAGYKDIEQAKKYVAREIFKEIDSLFFFSVEQPKAYQSLKSKYLEGQ